jgi:hypothetical protein
MFEGWRRKKRAIGGFHTGKFSIRDRGMPELTDFYNTWIGMKIVESTFGIESYSGIVWQLDLIKNGVNYRRTLNPKYWHNRVKVFYTRLAPYGDQAVADWSENTDSSGIYGKMEYIYAVGETTTTQAQAKRNNALVKYAWPKSRHVGGVSVGETKTRTSRDGLYVTVAGFSSTMNWLYRETSENDTASNLISTLLAETEFVTAGRIETNSLSIGVGVDPIPQRIGDTIEKIVEEGDDSQNLWKGGVYAGQKFVYEQVPTTIDYIMQNGALLNKAGTPVDPALINPGFYVRDTNAPRGGQPPGTSNIWDDPQVSYCDEVEFIWPNMLKLKFPGEMPSIDVVGSGSVVGINRVLPPPAPPGNWTDPPPPTYPPPGAPPIPP